MSIYLSGFAYEVGERTRRVADLDEVSGRPRLAAAVRSMGLDSFCETDRSPIDLAMACAARTLELSPVNPASIDAVIYATSTLWSDQHYSTNAISRLLSKLGLTNAYPYGLFFSGCGNVMSAIQLGAALLRSGMRSVLVAVSDVRSPDRSAFTFLGGAVKATEAEWSSVVDDIPAIGWSVTSDGAGSFLMSAAPSDGLELLGLRQNILANLGASYPNIDPVALIVRLAKGFRRTTEEVLRDAGLSRADIAFFLPNVLSLTEAVQLGDTLGFPVAKLYNDKIAAYGHIRGGTDVIVAIVDLLAAKRLPPQSHLFALATGHTMWGAAALRRGVS